MRDSNSFAIRRNGKILIPLTWLQNSLEASLRNEQSLQIVLMLSWALRHSSILPGQNDELNARAHLPGFSLCFERIVFTFSKVAEAM